MTSKNVGLCIMAEVLSHYHDRPHPEVLIGAGTFALGREACKSYPGWGVVCPSPWANRSHDHQEKPIFSECDPTGWIVVRISQEHGILSWQGPREKLWWPAVGEKLTVWPNHACVAGLGFDWYLVVDTDSAKTSKIADIWMRCRG